MADQDRPNVLHRIQIPIEEFYPTISPSQGERMRRACLREQEQKENSKSTAAKSPSISDTNASPATIERRAFVMTDEPDESALHEVLVNTTTKLRSNFPTSPCKATLPRKPAYRLASKYDESSGADAKAKSPSPNDDYELAYNEYGELVRAGQIQKPPKLASELSVLEIIRILKKTFHFKWRQAMGEVMRAHFQPTLPPIEPSADAGLSWKNLWSCWEIPLPPSDIIAALDEAVAQGKGYSGPPRVLELGCGDGAWCFNIKEAQPGWIVEGVDDADHWTSAYPDVELSEHYGAVHLSQTQPEFTVRNLNQLLCDEPRFKENLYSIIRGREVFCKAENFKTMVDDIRRILKPGGVIEFVETDPRPRSFALYEKHGDPVFDCTSGAPECFPCDTAARFEDPRDKSLATDAPSLLQRVQHRLSGGLRPRDGVPAERLRDYLEGGGFWDVQEMVFRLPIGGPTAGGQRLRDLMLEEQAMEDEVPKLKDFMPPIASATLESGAYYVNLHIVTGRKPRTPRIGDALADGTRALINEARQLAAARAPSSPAISSPTFSMLPGAATGSPSSSSTGSRGSTPAAVPVTRAATVLSTLSERYVPPVDPLTVAERLAARNWWAAARLQQKNLDGLAQALRAFHMEGLVVDSEGGDGEQGEKNL